MNTIYLVTTSKHFWDYVLKGFADDSEDIRRIVQNYFRDLKCQEDVGVLVDMEKMTATVISPGLEEETYYIREIKRVT